MSRRLPFALLLFVVSLAYLSIGYNRNLSHYDEGLITVGAMRVLAGEMPHRDFWSNYAPGQYYLVAALFRLVGPSLLAERVFATTVCALLLVLVYLLAERLGAGRWGLVAWLVGLAWMGTPIAAGNLGTSLLCGLGSCYCWLAYLQGGAAGWGLAAGLAAGATALLRHDLGVYTLLAQTSVAAVYLVRSRRGWSSLGLYWLGFLLLVVPVVIIFLVKVPLYILKYDFVDFPTRIYPAVRGVPYPTPVGPLLDLLNGGVSLRAGVRDLLESFPFYFPFLVYALGLIWLSVGTRRGRLNWSTPEPWGFVLIGATGLLYVGHASVRHDQGHLSATALPSGVLLALMVRRAWPAQRPASARRWALGSLLAVALASVLVRPAFTRINMLADLALHGQGPTFSVPRARGIVMSPGEEHYQAAVQWVRRNVPPGEPIFVGGYRHDRIFINEVTFYFLAERPPATRYQELHPGIATTAPIQEEIIAELQDRQIAFVILAYQPIPENERVGPPDSRLLDEYLWAHYARVCSWDGYAVYLRADSLEEFPLSPCE